MSLPANDWDTRYQGEAYLFGVEPNAFLARQKDRLPQTGRALALADGEGRNGVWLAQQGLSVLSLDSSPVAQAKAAALAKARGVSLDLLCADLSQWIAPRAAYEVVAAIFIQFAPPPLRARLFREMIEGLKPGGLLLLEGYRPEQIAYGTGGPRAPEHLYTEALLRGSFADLEILTLSSYDAVIEEGAGHSGLSALIDMVARKPG